MVTATNLSFIGVHPSTGARIGDAKARRLRRLVCRAWMALMEICWGDGFFREIAWKSYAMSFQEVMFYVFFAMVDDWSSLVGDTFWLIATGKWIISYTLWQFNIAVENHHLEWDNPP